MGQGLGGRRLASVADFPDCKFRFFPRWSRWPLTDDGRQPPDSLRGHSQCIVMNTAPEARSLPF